MRIERIERGKKKKIKSGEGNPHCPSFFRSRKKERR